MKLKKPKSDKFFKDLKKSLEEFADFQKGKIKLSVQSFEVPEPPSGYKSIEIKKIRKQKNYSQGIFAKVLNVSVKTVQSWEAGKRKPSQAALRLIEIVDKGIYNPKILRKR